MAHLHLSMPEKLNALFILLMIFITDLALSPSHADSDDRHKETGVLRAQRPGDHRVAGGSCSCLNFGCSGAEWNQCTGLHPCPGNTKTECIRFFFFFSFSSHDTPPCSTFLFSFIHSHHPTIHPIMTSTQPSSASASRGMKVLCKNDKGRL